ncbi:MAG: hypothetical protein I8H77_00355 [Comamonadaceae bacterium]|nr:hypothetical protein [Comamonadaceae bacterium]
MTRFSEAQLVACKTAVVTGRACTVLLDIDGATVQHAGPRMLAQVSMRLAMSWMFQPT